MAEKFNEFVKRNEKLLLKLEKSLPPDQYIRKINSFFVATNTLYPQETQALATKLKIDQFLEKISKKVKTRPDILEKIRFDYVAEEVVVEDKKIKMTSGKEIINLFFKIDENQSYYFFILSLLTDQKVFETIQAYLFLESRD